jgi:NAD(P)H dehydrogenase (quinone)
VAERVNSFSLLTINAMDHQSLLPKILVAGAGGHLGKRVVELLYAQGYANLVAASRTPTKLQQFADLGIELRKADFNDPNTLHTAFRGIDRLLLISTDELHTPGLRVLQHVNAIQAAKAAGVKHIVYTSMPNPATSVAIPFAADHVTTEQALIESGLNYTILRVSWYCENLLAYLPQIIRTGKWPTIAGSGKIAFVPREDVARVTAAALTGKAENRVYDVTGTEALTIAEIAGMLRATFGRNVTVEHVKDDEIKDALLSIGIPEAFLPTVIMTDLNTKAGQFDVVSDAIEDLSGNPPQSLQDFLKANASRFVSVP